MADPTPPVRDLAKRRADALALIGEIINLSDEARLIRFGSEWRDTFHFLLADVLLADAVGA